MHLRETLRDGFNWRGCISWFVNIKDCSDTFSTFLQNKSHVCLSHVFRRRSYELSGQVFSLSCEADHHRVTHSLKLSRFFLLQYFLTPIFWRQKAFFTPIFWQQKGEIYLQEELGAIIHLALPEIKKHSSQKPIRNKADSVQYFLSCLFAAFKVPASDSRLFATASSSKSAWKNIQLISSQFHSRMQMQNGSLLYHLFIHGHLFWNSKTSQTEVFQCLVELCQSLFSNV